jgi:hypothetical protein
MMADRKIELPPVVAQVVIGLGNFLGRHGAEGVKRAKQSALREVGAILKRAGDVANAKADEDEVDNEDDDVEVVVENRPRGRTRR